MIERASSGVRPPTPLWVKWVNLSKPQSTHLQNGSIKSPSDRGAVKVGGEMPYLFPIAAVSKYPAVSGLKQNTIFIF